MTTQAVPLITLNNGLGLSALGRIGLVGVSVGGTLALLTAATPELAARISIVACIAPLTDLHKMLMLATTGIYPSPDGQEP